MKDYIKPVEVFSHKEASIFQWVENILLAPTYLILAPLAILGVTSSVKNALCGTKGNNVQEQRETDEIEYTDFMKQQREERLEREHMRQIEAAIRADEEANREIAAAKRRADVQERRKKLEARINGS